jgi:hypothetical protein
VSAERDAIQAEYEIALARIASGLRVRQERLPLWVGELLEQYGVACCKRGRNLAHTQKTLKPSTQGPWQDDEETPLEIRFDDDGR